MFVLKRPGLDEFLEEMAQYFEIVIYTASLSLYADSLIDLLDTKHLVSHRLFREHCTFNNSSYVKDLSKLGRNPKDIIIVDNSPICYSLQPENGIPILTWTDNFNDNMLKELSPLLRLLSKVDDVRPCLLKYTKEEINYSKITKNIENYLNKKTRNNSKNKKKNIPNSLHKKTFDDIFEAALTQHRNIVGELKISSHSISSFAFHKKKESYKQHHKKTETPSQYILNQIIQKNNTPTAITTTLNNLILAKALQNPISNSTKSNPKKEKLFSYSRTNHAKKISITAMSSLTHRNTNKSNTFNKSIELSKSNRVGKNLTINDENKEFTQDKIP